MAKVKTPTLDMIAKRIRAHLARIEADPKLNPTKDNEPGGLRQYWNSNASSSGSRIFVTYVSYQGDASLTKSDAMNYLEHLDAGYVGKHWHRREKEKAS